MFTNTLLIVTFHKTFYTITRCFYNVNDKNVEFRKQAKNFLSLIKYEKSDQKGRKNKFYFDV